MGRGEGFLILHRSKFTGIWSTHIQRIGWFPLNPGLFIKTKKGQEMFENTLLIINSDYLHKRKPLLIHLTRKCFQIQGNRLIQFTPESAAEFYNYIGAGALFMRQVILLAKGKSEAFILAKEDAVTDLIATLVCYL